MSYFRFEINLWMQRVNGCTPGPSNHSTLRARPAPQTREHGLHHKRVTRAQHTRVHPSLPQAILRLCGPGCRFGALRSRALRRRSAPGGHRGLLAADALPPGPPACGEGASARRHANRLPHPPPTHPFSRLDMWACARAGCHYVHAKFATGDRAEGCAAAAARALRASRWCGVGCDYAVITALDAESSSV